MLVKVNLDVNVIAVMKLSQMEILFALAIIHYLQIKEINKKERFVVLAIRVVIEV